MPRPSSIPCPACHGAGVTATVPPGPCDQCQGDGAIPVSLPDPATLEVRFVVDADGMLHVETTRMEGSMGTILELANRLHAATGVYPVAVPGSMQ